MKGVSSLQELVIHRAEQLGDSPLYSFINKRLEDTCTISFQGLLYRSQAVANLLPAEKGTARPVILFFPHCPEFIYSFFGAMFAGYMPMPMAIPRGGNVHSISPVLKHSKAKIVLTTKKSITVELQQLFLKHKVRLIYVNNLDYCPSQESSAKLIVNAKEDAFIQYSSGSTSDPKGVLITQSNIFDNSKKIKDAFGGSEQDKGCCWLPFYHDMGLIGHVIQPLYTKIHNRFLSPLSFVGNPYLWLKAISDFQITISGGPNFAYNLCNEKIDSKKIDQLNLESWRVAYCGAERILTSTVDRFSEIFRKAKFKRSSFYPCYGMAESTLFITGGFGIKETCNSSQDRQYVSVGSVPPDTTLKIVDPATKKELSNGETGEIWVNSNSIAGAYYNNEQLSNAIFNNSIDGQAGFLKTGDLGFIKDNNLYFVSRKKNMLKINGQCVYLEDIDASISRLLKDKSINKIATILVDFDERSECVILIQQNKRYSTEIASVQIKKQISSHVVAEFGIYPRDVFVFSSQAIPLTTSGKIRRVECERLYVENSQTMSNSALA